MSVSIPKPKNQNYEITGKPLTYFVEKEQFVFDPDCDYEMEFTPSLDTGEPLPSYV